MTSTRTNERAPAELEDSTRATLRSASGDGYPLHASYDGPSCLVNTREVVFVSVDSGFPMTQLLPRSEVAPTTYDRLGKGDARRARVLAHDADASDDENARAAKLVVECIVATNMAKTVPVIVARSLVSTLHRRDERIRELEYQLAKRERYEQRRAQDFRNQTAVAVSTGLRV